MPDIAEFIGALGVTESSRGRDTSYLACAQPAAGREVAIRAAAPRRRLSAVLLLTPGLCGRLL